jgi:Multimeric flavodoxin WrbA
MILGISASGRKNGITAKTVKAILESSNCEYKYISLSGKRINGCMGCTLCAADNKCKMKDDWNEIAENMLAADAIVFGAPNYAGMINALGHACLERTFCFRHRGVLSLAGKLGVIVSTCYDVQENDMISMMIEGAMKSNMMTVIGGVTAKGYAQCYTCGYGHNCSIGNVVKDHGVLDKIEKKHLPRDFEEQEETIAQVESIGRLLEAELNKLKAK